MFRHTHPSRATGPFANYVRRSSPHEPRRAPQCSAGGRPPAFDPGIYKKRNTAGRGFNRLKHLRDTATHYDKYATTFLSAESYSAK
ncbi:Transposase DDE domain-containing protein [Arthrobacter crystallopoietes]|uniref:Transposase DDE domain-containing protein n=1 Tax=Crystallibacter crystallopoietes TaxID=37928 RepID=A0A1H0ZQG9_9MICC|nr:hypothetical protein AC20117_14775 [Arthrobacter crystallopoietes]SDQ29680.1 Transposase DDE domain-containing protein [Arthrobacter crystallopoietes]